MAFKMTGINFGKGTGSSKGFPEVGTHTTNPDGSVTWDPSDEYKKRLNKTSKVEVTKEDPLGLTSNQRKIYNRARNEVIKSIQKGNEPSGYATWLKNIAKYGGREGEEFLYQFVEPISKLDYGSRKMKKFYKKLDEALGEDGTLNTSILNDVYKQMRIDQNPEGVDISYHDPHTGNVNAMNIKGQVEGTKMRYAEDDEGPGYDATLKGKHYTEEELEEIRRAEEETGILAFDPADTNKDDYVSEEERLAYENMMADEGNGEGDGEGDGSGDGEIVAIGSGEGDANNDVSEKTFDPRDTNKDGTVDRKEKRAAMFADSAAPQSSMAKWNNKNLENMTKQTLMNADRNPYKFGSKEHEEYTNNKSRAKGLAIKQRYNKFL